MTNDVLIPIWEKVNHYNDVLMGAPIGVLIFIFCIVASYMLVWIPAINNKWIPGIILAIGIGGFMLAAPRGELPLRIWVVKNFIMGFIIAGAAWFIHNRRLKKLEGETPAADKPVPETQAGPV